MFPEKKQWQGWTLPSRLSALGAYLGVLAIVLATYFYFNPLQQPQELRPGDFQVRLLVAAHGSAFDSQYLAPTKIHLYLRSGPLLIKSALILQTEAAREFPSSKNPVRTWEYVDVLPLIDGSGKGISLEALDGEMLQARIPVRAFKFKGDAVSYQLHFFIAGNEIVAKANDLGLINIPISF